MFIPAFTTNAIIFVFHIFNFPWLNGDIPTLPLYGVYISQLVRFARCCTSILNFHSKKSSNHFQTTDIGLQVSQASKKKTFGKFSM